MELQNVVSRKNNRMPRSEAKKIFKSTSWTSPRFQRGEPFKQAQPLYEVNIRKQCWKKHIVRPNGQVRPVSAGHLPFATFERRSVHQHECLKHRKEIPVDEPKTVEDVIHAACRDFNIAWPTRKRCEPAPAPRKMVFKPSNPCPDVGLARWNDYLEYRLSRLEARAQESPPPDSKDDSFNVEIKASSTWFLSDEDVLEHDAGTDWKPPSGFTLQGAAETVYGSIMSSDQATNALHNPRLFHRRTPVQRVLEAFDAKGRLVPWDEHALSIAFASAIPNGATELGIEHLSEVLAELSISDVEEEQVLLIASQQTGYNSLDFSEFQAFLRAFRQWEVSQLWFAFCEADSDQDGVISFKELYNLLRQTGYHVTQRGVRKLKEEGEHATFDVMEFEQIAHDIRNDGGFVGDELQSLRVLFSRSAGSERKLSVEGVWRMLNYMGYMCDKSDIVRLAADVSRHRPPLVFNDVLDVIRAFRDGESEKLFRVVQRESGNGSDYIRYCRIGHVLGELGYHISDVIIKEILADVQIADGNDEVSMNELDLFLAAFRDRQGFSRAETSSMHEAFRKGDRADLGTLDIPNVGVALRWLGISMTLVERLQAIREVDLAGQGEINFPEFLKLVRRCHQKEDEHRRRVFWKVAGSSGFLPVGLFPETYSKITGTVATMSSAKMALRSLYDKRRWPKELNVNEFLRLCKVCLQLDAMAGRENAGYAGKDLKRLHKRFKEFDTNNDGMIDRSELTHLLARVFPESAEPNENIDAIRRTHWLKGLLADIDKDNNGELDFSEFMWLMRAADDARDVADMKEEELVTAELNLSAEEVDGFREVFLDKAGSDGEVAFADVIGMLQFAELTKEGTIKVLQLLRQETSSRNENHDAVRFPDFLRVMANIMSDTSLRLDSACLRVQHMEGLHKTWAEAIQRQMDQLHLERRRRAVISDSDALL